MTPLEAQVQIIPISKIVISKTNPRKVFNEESLNQLSKSIAENGLQQAILLRPKGAKFELVFGERRLKAKQLLKEKTIEARVQKLTDKQALEIQLIENKERQDVHPLNEAISIQKLLEFKNNSVSEISKILARSESYVTQRLQLIKLTDQWKNTYFEHKEMTLSVGLLVSKLSESDQNSVFKQAIGNDGLIRRYKEIHNIVERLINDLEKSIFSLEEENISMKFEKHWRKELRKYGWQLFTFLIFLAAVVLLLIYRASYPWVGIIAGIIPIANSFITKTPIKESFRAFFGSKLKEEKFNLFKEAKFANKLTI